MSSFAMEFELIVGNQEINFLEKRFNTGSNIYNLCLRHCIKQLNRLKRDKKYRKFVKTEYAEHIMEESFVTLVPFNPIKYLKNVEQRTVRRNVTLPYWMNEAARNLDINFSKTLQEAIMDKLNTDEDEE